MPANNQHQRERFKGLLAIVLLGLLIVNSGISQPLENWFQDHASRALMYPVATDIAVIEIDARSIHAIGQWPWPRSTYAPLLEKLAEANIEHLFIDIDFSSGSNPLEDRILWDSLTQFSQGDAALSLPAFLQAGSLSSSSMILSAPVFPDAIDANLVSVNVRPDTDGLVRIAEKGFTHEQVFYPNAGHAIVSAKAQDVSIDFSIHPSSIELVSFIDILENRYDARLLKGKKVLLGATAIELGDNIAVPVYGSLPGVVLQGLIGATHLQGGLEKLTEAEAKLALLPLLIVACFIFSWLNWSRGLFALCVIFSCWLAIAVTSHHVYRLQLPMALPLVFMLFAYVTIQLIRLDRNLLEKFQLKMKLLDSDVMLDSLFKSSSDCLFCIDARGDITNISEKALSLIGKPREALMHTSIFPQIPLAHRQLLTPSLEPLETQLLLSDGQEIPIELSVSHIALGDENCFLLVVNDQRRRIQREEELRYQALHDELTGLPNRNCLFEDLSTSLSSSTQHTFFMLDLSSFKEVNDHYGHETGDRILRIVARRIADSLNETSYCYRINGDEFGVLFDSLLTPDESELYAKQLIAEVSRPFDIEDSLFEVTAVVGSVDMDQTTSVDHSFGSLNSSTDDNKVERPEESSDTALAVLRNADMAVSRAKKCGQTFARFNADLDAQSSKNIHLVPKLRTAINDGELHLVFQPKINLLNRAVYGSEVLLRWTNTDGEPISPEVFIDVAERSGLIAPLTLHVMQQLLDMESYWKVRQLPPHIAVNLSAKLLSNREFLSTLGGMLVGSQGYFEFEFEITESALMHNRDRAIKSINQLRDAGYAIAIDDYGTGYSSLSYLRDLGASVLKIDKAFIDGIEPESENGIIVRSTASMAHELGLKVVAEGIEHESQAKLLETLNCDIGQGYLFGRPMTEIEFLQWFNLWTGRDKNYGLSISDKGEKVQYSTQLRAS